MSNPETEDKNNPANFRNIVAIRSFDDFDKHYGDSDRPSITGIDNETGEKISVAFDDNVPIGKAILCAHARYIGESGGLKRYRARRGFVLLDEDRVNRTNEPVELSERISIGMARISRNWGSRCVDLIAPLYSELFGQLLELKENLCQCLDEKGPFTYLTFATLRVFHSRSFEPEVFEIKRQYSNETGKRMVRHFFDKTQDGKRITALFEELGSNNVVVEVIQGIRLPMTPRSHLLSHAYCGISGGEASFYREEYTPFVIVFDGVKLDRVNGCFPSKVWPVFKPMKQLDTEKLEAASKFLKNPIETAVKEDFEVSAVPTLSFGA